VKFGPNIIYRTGRCWVA